MYQRTVDVGMLNAVKSVLADVSSISPSSEQGQWARTCSDEGLTLETSANTLFTTFNISTSTLRWYICTSYRHADQNQFYSIVSVHYFALETYSVLNTISVKNV